MLRKKVMNPLAVVTMTLKRRLQPPLNCKLWTCLRLFCRLSMWHASLAIGRLRPKPPGESDVMDNADTNQDDGISIYHRNPSATFSQSGQQACLEDGKMNESPPIILSLFDPTHASRHPHTYLHLPPVQPSRLNSRRLALYHEVVRKDILSQLPPATVGRALVQFDMDNVAWMHWYVERWFPRSKLILLDSCYHGPTFRRCDYRILTEI